MADWDQRFLELAKHVSNWSKDPSTKVGCVIVDERKTVLSLGYNGFPRGVEDTPTRLKTRETKLNMVQHAEANAILNYNGNLHGTTAYVTHKPCSSCCGALIQAGITEIVSRPISEYLGLAERLQASYQATDAMLNDTGIIYREVASQIGVAAE